MLLNLHVVVVCTVSLTRTVADLENTPAVPSTSDSTTHLSKRSYGVRPLANNKPQGAFGPWPAIASVSGHTQAIRYCFKDARSARNLQKIVEAATAKWASAMQHSTMSIVPDNERALLCSDEGVRADALVIFDATKDGDEQWNYQECETGSAGTGYQYGSEAKGRHCLDFCNLDPDDAESTQAKAARTMMHELGHAIGLQHEHQRPDRNKYLTFRCENIAGYAAAVNKALADIPLYLFDDNEEAFGTDEDPNIKARMLIVCNDDRAAADYFPAAFSFIPGSEMVLPQYKDIFKAYESSTSFDFESIMIYNSYDFSPAGTDVNDPKRWVLARKDGSAVLQGGSTDAAKAALSAGDIARVKLLYPKSNE